MLVVHRKNQGNEVDYWRNVIPDSTSVRNFVVTELHAVPTPSILVYNELCKKFVDTFTGKE